MVKKRCYVCEKEATIIFTPYKKNSKPRYYCDKCHKKYFVKVLPEIKRGSEE